VLISFSFGFRNVSRPTTLGPYTIQRSCPSSDARESAPRGLAYNRPANLVYAAAYMKQFSDFGPNGTAPSTRLRRRHDGDALRRPDAIFGAVLRAPDRTISPPPADTERRWAAVGNTALGGMDVPRTAVASR